MANILQSIQRRWIGRSKREEQVKLKQTPNASQHILVELIVYLVGENRVD